MVVVAVRFEGEERLAVVVFRIAHDVVPCHRKVDIRLHGKDNSISHGARPVY